MTTVALQLAAVLVPFAAAWALLRATCDGHYTDHDL